MRLTDVFQVAFTAWSQRREAQKLKDVVVQELSGTPPSPPSREVDIELGQLDQAQPPIVDEVDMGHSNQAQPPADDEIEMERSNQAQPPTDDKTRMENSIGEAKAYFKRNPWTMTHSFYAVMGGYAIDTSALPDEQKFLPGSRDRLTLTPDGLEFLAKQRPDLIPRVSIAEIQDKSKADTFAKGIITVQTSFFIIQCVYRLIQHLPISLLELNTFAHTLCALLTYVFWWEKPLEVSEPSLISIGEFRELWAALCFGSSFRDRPIKDSDHFEFLTSKSQVPVPRENTDAELRLRVGDTLGNWKYRGPPEWLRGWYKSEEYWIYTPRDRLRWSLASSCVNSSPWELASKFHTRDTTVELPEDTLSDRAANWPSGFLDGLVEDMTDKAGIKLLVAFTLAGLSYGALHLLAWNFPFASHAEHLLWKISGLTVAASGPVFIFWKLVLFLFRKLINPLPRQFDDCCVWIFVGISGVYSLLYIFARAYLIVESFISFVYLPDAAFHQPQWTYYFPHIG